MVRHTIAWDIDEGICSSLVADTFTCISTTPKGISRDAGRLLFFETPTGVRNAIRPRSRVNTVVTLCLSLCFTDPNIIPLIFSFIPIKKDLTLFTKN